MTDPLDEDDTTAKSSMDWPDPSRPIISHQPGGYGQPSPPCSVGEYPLSSPTRFRRRLWAVLAVLAVGALAAVLVVWLV